MTDTAIIKEIRKYFKEIRGIYLCGDYTEWSYRTPFENFILYLCGFPEPGGKHELGK